MIVLKVKLTFNQSIVASTIRIFKLQDFVNVKGRVQCCSLIEKCGIDLTLDCNKCFAYFDMVVAEFYQCSINKLWLGTVVFLTELIVFTKTQERLYS